MRLKGSALSHTTRLCTFTLAAVYTGETEAPEAGAGQAWGLRPSCSRTRAPSFWERGACSGPQKLGSPSLAWELDGTAVHV